MAALPTGLRRFEVLLRRWRTELWHLRTGGLAQWRSHRSRRQPEPLSPDGSVVDQRGRRTYAPWPLPDLSPARPGLRVGVILDDFSRLAMSYEWEQVELTPAGWSSEVTERPIDLLFVESAWQGNHGAWQYHLTGPSSPRPALVELVDWCRKQRVPTVFWNKEDPAHFADFLETARLFDHVFTTDSTKVPDYREHLGHSRVGTLMFAAQPAIHNPVRPGPRHRTRDIAFAGMYFAHKYPERREQMELLLGAADRVGRRMEHGLEIYSRHLGADPRYQFPTPLDQRVVGSLPYDRMLSAYRGYRVFLNVNSVVTSPSMCARRIFEITASGATVVSTPSPAIDAVFPDGELTQVGTASEAEFALRALVGNDSMRARRTHRAQRIIWQQHTYSHRVDSVLRAVGAGAHLRTEHRPVVSALVSTNRPHQLEHVLRTVGEQRGIELQLALLAHGFAPDEAWISRLAREHGIEHLTLLTAEDRVPLGDCLNRLVDAADGDVLAKMDDDDLYGPDYLSDAVNAMTYSGADLVGKQAHYVYLAGSDVMVLRRPELEHVYTDRVMGSSMVFTRELADQCPFKPLTRGEDSAFLAAAVDSGARVYSADRFNYVQMRDADTGAHTWAVSDLELIASGRVEVHGFHPAHAMN